MEHCYRCDNKLTQENFSNEHILLNAIGGRLKSKALLCRECNSHYGALFDNEMASQLNFFANYLNIKREKGVPQDLKGVYSISGESAILRSDGSHAFMTPKITEKKINEKEIDINIRAKNIKESQNIIEGLKRKYPGWNFNDRNETINIKPDEPISFVLKIGVNEAHKSVTKSLINYYLLKGGNKDSIKHLLPYLDGNNEFSQVLMYLPSTWIYEPKKDEVSHIIRIKGSSTDRILYGYIEFFNVYKYLAILNDSYDGKSIDYTYAFDVISQKELDVVISFNPTRDDLINFFVTKAHMPVSNLHDRFFRFAEIAMRRKDEQSINKIINEVVNKHISETNKANDFPDIILKEIEERISNELKQQTFHISDPTTDAPPENLQQRNRHIFEKVRKWFS
jgi:hypothetical protein